MDDDEDEKKNKKKKQLLTNHIDIDKIMKGALEATALATEGWAQGVFTTEGVFPVSRSGTG